MAETYFASFCLGDPESKPPPFEEVAALVRRWALQSRNGVDVGKLGSVSFSVSDDHVAGAGRLQIRRSVDGETELLGLRLNHPDNSDASLLWETELVLVEDKTTCQLRVAARTSCGHVRDYVAPVHLPAPSRPRIVRDLVQKFGAFEGLTRLTPVAVPVTPHDFENHFISLLENPERAVPLIVISTRANDRPLIDPKKIADQLVGLAVVCAFESRFVSFRLTDALGKDWSVWDGAVRIYWPRLQYTQSPALHPIFSRHSIEDLERHETIARRLLGIVSRAATQRTAPGLVRWSEVERRINAARLQEARNRGDQAALLGLLEEDNAELAKRKGELELKVSTLELQLVGAQEEFEKARDAASYWKEEFLRVQKSRVETVPVMAPEEPPSSVADALERVGQAYQDRLAIKLNSVSDKNSPFEDVESFYKALVFLATIYVDARRGTKPCPDLDAECRRGTGFQYKSGQSSVTMGKWRNEYETTWKGEKVSLEEHLSKGSDRDARYTIRVGFFFDKQEGRVVIGYVGQHQTTRQS